MFADKKTAEEHDKMLELAANITSLLETRFATLEESLAEEIGLLFAQHKDTLVKAIKGKPELILQIGNETASSTPEQSLSDND